MKRVDECGPNTPDTNWLANVYVHTQQFGKLNSRFTLAWISFK